MKPTTASCHVCSTCHEANPECPCCNPLFAVADTCFNCYAYNETIIAACGIDATSITYECNENTTQCTAYQSTLGKYKKYNDCKAACQFKCVNNTCVISEGGTGKSSCEEVCGQKFKCINNQCVASPGGTDKSACEAVCG
jgi:hypothetical protein